MHFNLEGDTFVDQIAGRREHFVPWHSTDVVEYLAQHPALPPERQATFRELASLILSLLHHLYRQRHEQLSYVYAPLDPDRDRLLRTVPTPEQREGMSLALLERIRESLQYANYHQLSQEEIQNTLQAASQWGVRMRVNFGAMNILEVYARGSVLGRREVRRWTRWFRLEKVEVPLFQRLVVIFRPKEFSTAAPFDPRHVRMRMFKNVPQQDVDMMLPATGLQLSWLDGGEQQQACEAAMAYLVSAIVLADRPSCSLVETDVACEEILREATGLMVDFDVEATVRMLIHLGIMRVDAQGWRAIPLEAAREQLDHTWDSWFGA